MKMVKNNPAEALAKAMMLEREHVEMMKSWRATNSVPLGQGSFGKVYAGEAVMSSGRVKEVALKAVNISTFIISNNIIT